MIPKILRAYVPLPTLPSKVVVNEYLNIVPHDAQEHPVNANANLAWLWASEVQCRGFNPNGVVFECFGKSQTIQVRDDGSIHIHAFRLNEQDRPPSL